MSDPVAPVQPALAAFRRGDLSEAERLCREVIAADEWCSDAHHLLAVIAARQGRTIEALAGYDRALAARPDDPRVLSNRGAALVELKRYGEALASCERALVLRPDYPPALCNRGNTLRALKRYDEALASYDRALALSPRFPEALSNRGTALHCLQRFDEALASYDCALSLRPDYAHALSNRGLALQQLGRFDEALASYDRALKARPDYPDAHCNRALLLLLRGRYREGWAEYEWRRRSRAWKQRALAGPEWRGEDLRGRRLLLYAEQGLGDTIQFCRFVPLLAERGADILFEVQPCLAGLLAGLAGARHVLRPNEAPPAYDCHLPLLSVPLVLGLEAVQIPAAVPYLHADPQSVAAWSSRLPAGGLRVGIAWQDNPRGNVDRGRSIPLAAFAPLAQVPGVRLVNLGKFAGVEQLASLPPGMAMADLGPGSDAEEDRFLDAAAVIAQLDLVVAGDGAIAHLAGALGRPVWVVLSDVPDWQWLTDRRDSPWYPTARLFRQTRGGGDWSEAMDRVAAALAGMAPATAAAPAASVRNEGRIPGYVISLARRADRRERFMRWNAGKGIELHMFDAVDGRTLRKQELIEQGIVADETLCFSNGALGNALSHRRLWETCIAQGRTIMIFEDDAFVPGNIREWLDRIVAEAENGCDIFYAGYNRDAILSIGYEGQWCNLAFEAPPAPFETLIARREKPGRGQSHCLVDTRLIWGTLGYAVSPRGARNLLNACFPLSDRIQVRMYGSGRLLTPYALDGVINVVIQRGLVRARTVFPPLVTGPNEQADSDVQIAC